MKAVWFFPALLFLSSCVTLDRSYDYTIARYPAGIWGVHVYFWGDNSAPDWKERAHATALKMVQRELAAHGLSGEQIIITELAPMEGGGIFVYGFAGSAQALEGWTPDRLEALIDPRPHPYQEPYAHGSGKLPPERAAR